MRKYSFQMLSAIFMLMWQASCGPKQSSDYAVQDAIYKTDSAANATPAYKNTTSAIKLYEARIQKHKDTNKNILKYYAKNYIRQTIKDADLQTILLSGMDRQFLMEVSCLDMDESACQMTDLNSHRVTQMRFFRRNQDWYNALIMYLLDRYDEAELLNSGFFNVVGNAALKKTFLYNSGQIARLSIASANASDRANHIYNNLWLQYSNGK